MIDDEIRARREEHIKALKEMRDMMLNDDNWENMKRLIEAVMAGGMALQRLNMIDFGESEPQEADGGDVE